MANIKVTVPNGEVLDLVTGFNLVAPASPDAPKFPGTIQLKFARIGKKARAEAKLILAQRNELLDKYGERVDPDDTTSAFVPVTDKATNQPIPNSVKFQDGMEKAFKDEEKAIMEATVEFDVDPITQDDLSKIQLPGWFTEQLLPFIAA